MTVSYNPFDPAQVDNDEEVLTQLRHEAPRRRADAGRLLRDAPRGRRRDQPRREALPAGAVPAARGGHPHARRAAARRVEPARPHEDPQDPRVGAEPAADPRARAARRPGVRELVDAFAAQGLGRPHRRPRPPAPGAGDRRAHRRARRGPRTSCTSTPTSSSHAVQEQDPELQQAAIDRVAEFDVHFLDVIRERRNADRQARRRHDRAHRVPRRGRQRALRREGAAAPLQGPRHRRHRHDDPSRRQPLLRHPARRRAPTSASATTGRSCRSRSRSACATAPS